jgi:hypothetical protein
MTARTAVLLLGGILALPAAAAAQPPWKWDTNASFGFIWGDVTGEDRNYDEDPNVAYNVDLGRYWSTHFKTDFGLLLTPERQFYDFTSISRADPIGGFTFIEGEHRLTAVSAAATYQFFENEFMHPYVSAGVQIGALREHRHRAESVYTVGRVSTTVPALDERSTTTLVRPFVALGAKSYFNERTFIRSELAVAAGPRGFSHALLRLGFGVDF